MFYPIVSSSDDRRTKGCTPLVLRNCMVEPQPEGTAKRATYVITPTMGRVSRVTPSAGALIRGVFSRPGVQSGVLYAVAGSKVYQISSAWAATQVGAVDGSDTVLFDSLGANVALNAAGSIYQYDGVNFQAALDADCPANAYTLASLGERLLTSARYSDTFDWSSVGDGLDWPASGFAASARMPDEIRKQAVIGGELWHFGAATAQPWRAVGGDDADAFDILSVVIDRGIAGREAGAQVDSSFMWVGDDRVLYMLNGYTPTRIVNREIEQALAALTEAEFSALQCFAYMQGSHLTWVLRMPTGKAFAYDLMTESWSERTTWGASRFAPCYYTYFHAAGKHVVASDESDTIYSWEPDTFSDAGGAHERIFTLHIPVAQRTIVSSLCLDLVALDQPLTGTGSAPVAQVTIYKDGGHWDSLQTHGMERMVSLGVRGQFNLRPMLWRLGMVNAADGLIVKVRITDPINFAASGVWINENPR